MLHSALGCRGNPLYERTGSRSKANMWHSKHEQARSVNSCVGSLLPNRESGSRPGIGCSACGTAPAGLTFPEIRILKANPLENWGKTRHLGNSPGPLIGVNPCVGFPDGPTSSLVRPAAETL